MRSQESPSELLYLLDEDLRHPVTASIADLSCGWHALPSAPGGASLDYIRGNLFDPKQMRPLHTDDETGHRLDDPVPPRTETPAVRMLAALVNAPGRRSRRRRMVGVVRA